MAYCKSCGAYIPDGISACLACGYDEAAEAQKSSGTATVGKHEKTGGREKYKPFDSDFLKQQLEEQRKRQQENSRKWAETEYAQRHKTKEEQTRNFTNTSGRSTGNDAARAASDVYQTVRRAMNDKDNSKTCAALSYFPGFFLLTKLLFKDDQFISYHAKQGRNLFFAGVLGTWLIPPLALPAWALMIYKGVNNAIKGEKKPLPYIGDILK